GRGGAARWDHSGGAGAPAGRVALLRRIDWPGDAPELFRACAGPRRRSHLDVRDADLEIGLAMALAAAIALATLVLEDVGLGPLEGAENLGGHGRIGDGGIADFRLAFAADEEHAIERDRLGIFGNLAVDVDR